MGHITSSEVKDCRQIFGVAVVLVVVAVAVWALMGVNPVDSEDFTPNIWLNICLGVNDIRPNIKGEFWRPHIAVLILGTLSNVIPYRYR